MLKKTFLVIALTTLSSSLQAATVSYYGYTLDTETHIVSGQGLEWMQWSETLGQSINQSLSTYSEDGWRVASTEEIASLFNIFDFGLTFVGDENISQIAELLPPQEQWPQVFQFSELFTPNWDGAWVGADEDEDGLYQFVHVSPPWFLDTMSGGWLPGYVELYRDMRDADATGGRTGVALVRDISEVPLPGAFWLFSSALLGLISIKRKAGNKLYNL